MNTTLAVICTIVAVMAIAFLVWRNRRRDLSQFKGEVYTDHEAITPKGVRVYSPRKIDNAALSLIDAGLDFAFDVAEIIEKYSGFKRHSEYKVWLFPKSDRCEQPGILQEVGNSAWDQHPEYDKDPRVGHTAICFTGKMRRTGNVGVGQPGMVIVDDLRVMQETVYNEAEHNILAECDPGRYMATSGEHSHPIFATPQLLVSRQQRYCGCSAPEMNVGS